MKKIIVVFVSAFLCLANSASATSFTDVNFVLMGGFTSCGSGDPQASGQAMYKPFQKMLGELQIKFPAQTFHFVVSCFNDSIPPEGQVQIITSDNPTIALTGNGDAMVGYARNFITPNGTAATFVVGHSYGGFLAMYVGQNLQSTYPLDGLYTIDPIGPRCDASGVIFGGSDCKEAPQGMDDEAILEQTKRWINIYEQSDQWLHSSAIGAAENVVFQYHGPHNEVDVDPRTWNTISDAVIKVLK